MPELHFTSTEFESPSMDLVGPRNAPLDWLHVQYVRLGKACRELDFETGGREFVLDIFGGACTVTVSSPDYRAAFEDIGVRPNVFAGRPTMVYMPRDSHVTISAETPTFEGALISAPGEERFPAVAVYPDENQTRQVGSDNWARTVNTAIGENVQANRLIVGETVNPPGNWSSAPPHRHDRNEGDERRMEEVYLYKTNPIQGFGLQRIYTSPQDPAPLDVTYTVRNNDVVVIPRGYHPVVAAPGYQLFYLWALAGEERIYGAWSDDPQHAWIKGLSV